MFRRTLIGFAAALVLATAVQASAPAPMWDQQRFERQFITMMIDHHYGAVKMAQLADGRTTHPELQAMTDEIETAQMAEIAEMQAWLQAWYGATHEPRLDRRTQWQVQMLGMLTGDEFEKVFMRTMIEHHAMAIRMGVDALQRAYHPELINMAAMMTGSQADEIAQLRLWLQQWYGITQVKGHGRH